MLCALTNDVDDPLREPCTGGYLERPPFGVTLIVALAAEAIPVRPPETANAIGWLGLCQPRQRQPASCGRFLTQRGVIPVPWICDGIAAVGAEQLAADIAQGFLERAGLPALTDRARERSPVIHSRCFIIGSVKARCRRSCRGPVYSVMMLFDSLVVR